jgi:GntR family transcriptional regulator
MTAARRPVRDSLRCDDARRVRDLLRAALNGDLYPDGYLPGETQLMEEFGASRSTVRDALGMLHAEGLIDRRKGLGTLVAHSKSIVKLTENHGVGEREPGSMWSGQMRVRLLEWVDATLPHIAAVRMAAEVGEPRLRANYYEV